MQSGQQDELDALLEAVLASSRALVAVAARSIAGTKDVTLPQFRMLVVLRDGPTTLSGLAGQLDVAPSTAMRMVDRLVAHGLVAREVPPDDRRVTRLSLTAAGDRTVAEVVARRRRDLRSVLQRVPEADREGIGRAMASFARAADELWLDQADRGTAIRHPKQR